MARHRARLKAEARPEAKDLAELVADLAPISGTFTQELPARGPTRTTPPGGAPGDPSRQLAADDAVGRDSTARIEGEIDLSDTDDVHDTIPAPPSFSEDEPVG